VCHHVNSYTLKNTLSEEEVVDKIGADDKAKLEAKVNETMS
jgi:hypothetical protein